MLVCASGAPAAVSGRFEMSILTRESTKATAPAVESASPAESTQVLITEQEVLAGTAAAVGLRTKSRRGWIAALRHPFATAEADRRPPRQHYPRRESYLDNPRMAREMQHLYKGRIFGAWTACARPGLRW